MLRLTALERCSILWEIPIQARILKTGDIVAVHECYGAYPLPEGLAEKTVVTVRKVDCGYADVADKAGRIWHLAISCMDVPCDVLWDGRWIDRGTHPDGETAHQAALEKIKAEQEARMGPNREKLKDAIM